MERDKLGYESGVAFDKELNKEFNESAFVDTWGVRLDNFLKEKKALNRFINEVDICEGEVYEIVFESEISLDKRGNIDINNNLDLIVGYMALSIYCDLIESGEEGKELAEKILLANM